MNPATKRINDSTDDSVSIETKKKKKHKRKEKKNKKKKRKHRASDSEPENHKKSKHKKHRRTKEEKATKNNTPVEGEDAPGPSVPVDLADTSKSRTPMTKEEWEKSQNVIRRVYDETGRSRLIKGDGEILEEIVSKERHREINRQATVGDGLYFQSKLQGVKK